MTHVGTSCFLVSLLATIVSAALAVSAPATETPKATGKPLAGVTHADGAANLTVLKVDGASVLPDLLFSSDGNFTYVLETNGLLRKIEVPRLIEERQLAIGEKCSAMGRSAEGLVVAVSGSSQVWVIDDATLNVKTKIPQGPVTKLVCAPGSSYALAQTGQDWLLLNLRMGKASGAIAHTPFKRRDKSGRIVPMPMFNVVQWVQMTPEGEDIVVSSGAESYVFDIEADELVCLNPPRLAGQDSAAPKTTAPGGTPATVPDARRRPCFAMSADGQYVLGMPRPTRSMDQPSTPGVSQPSPESSETEIYRFDPTGDAKLPVARIETTRPPTPQTIAFDRRGRQIYVQDGNGSLNVFNAIGALQKSYVIDSTTRSTPRGTEWAGARAIVVTPAGHQLLALTSDKLYWIRLPARVDTAAPAPNEDWLAAAEQPRTAGKGREVKLKAFDGRDQFLGERQVVGSGASAASITALTVDAKEALPCLLWAADGKSFYLIEKSGIVRKMAIGTFVEQRVLNAGRACSELLQSSAGLVLVVTGAQELWVLNPATLDVIETIPVPGLDSAAATAALPWAFASSGGRLQVVDLATGKMVSDLLPDRVNQELQATGRPHNPIPRTGFSNPAVTPDGKYLICQGLIRLRIDTAKGVPTLIFEEQGPPLTGRINISPDSKYLAVDGVDNVRPLAGMPDYGVYPTYIWAVTGFKQPISGINRAGMSIAFDPIGPLIYAGAARQGLATYETTGQLRSDLTVEVPEPVSNGPRIPLPAPPEKKPLAPIYSLYYMRQIAPAPDGKSVLVIGLDKLLWVVPPDLAGRKKVAEPVPAAVTTLPADCLKPIKLQVNCLIWSQDGKRVLEATPFNGIQAIDVPSLKITPIKFSGPGNAMAGPRQIVSGFSFSSEGLLALGSDVNVLVVDPVTFKIKRSIRTQGVQAIIGSPATDEAFGLGGNKYCSLSTKWGEVDQTVAVKDMKRSENLLVAKPFNGRRVDALGTSFDKQASITANGRYMIAHSYGQLCRLRTEKDTLVLEEIGPATGDPYAPAAVTADGIYVAVTGYESLADKPGPPPENHPPVNQGGSYVYAVANLQKPVAAFNTGRHCRTIAFDPTSMCFFGIGEYGTLVAFDVHGKPKGEYRLPVQLDSDTVFHMSPAGGRMIIHLKTGQNDTAQFYFELPAIAK